MGFKWAQMGIGNLISRGAGQERGKRGLVEAGRWEVIMKPQIRRLTRSREGGQGGGLNTEAERRRWGMGAKAGMS